MFSNEKMPRLVAELKAPLVGSHGGTAPCDCASSLSEATLRSLSAAKGNRGDIRIHGQEKRAWGTRFGRAKRARGARLRRKQPNQNNPTTRCIRRSLGEGGRLAIMNLALRGIEADFGKEHADTFRAVQHPIPRPRDADYVLANPPFNDSDWDRKHVALGLIFLKYISDSFEAHHAKLAAGEGDSSGADPEDPDEPSGARQPARQGSPKGQRGGAEQYKAENIFWVPQEARWSHLQGRAKLTSIGNDVDDAMDAIERDNPRIKGALNKNYCRRDLDKHRLGELIDLIGSIELTGRDHSPSGPSGDGGRPGGPSLPSSRHSFYILGRVFDSGPAPARFDQSECVAYCDDFIQKLAI